MNSEEIKIEVGRGQDPERRPGQRWRLAHGGHVIEGTLLERIEFASALGHWLLADVLRDGVSSNAGYCFFFSRWTDADATMTLIADAPGETAKALPTVRAVSRCALVFWSHTEVENRAKILKHAGTCSACRKPAPVADTKPACLFFGKKGSLHGGEVHKRFWRNMNKDVCSTFVCDYHYLHECEPNGGGSDVLRNDDRPALIDRRLRHDSMWLDTAEDA